MHIVHLCPSTGSFLSTVLESRCDIRPIHEISSLRSLKQAYHELGEVTHSTMFWVSLSQDCLSDNKFWVHLGRLCRYVRKGSGRLVFQLPRRSKAWHDEGVRSILDSYGLHKVTFDLGGENITVATNDASIRNFLKPH